MTLVSAGAAAVVYAITGSIVYATSSAIIALYAMVGLMRYGVIKKEGFNVFTGPADISRMVKKLKEGFRGKNDEEDFKDKHDDDEGFKGRKDDEEDFKDKHDDDEGFKGRKDDEEDFKDKHDDDEGFKGRRDDEEDFKDKHDDDEGFTDGYGSLGADLKNLIGINPFASKNAKANHVDSEGFRSRHKRYNHPHSVHHRRDRYRDDSDRYSEREPPRYRRRRDDDDVEGFANHVYQNIAKAGYNSPGFGMSGPLVEGFEDEKKSAKKGKPAPAMKKEEMAMPFKLGEIPSQVKNGPHIDAGSTLMKAVQSLNPDQINAMTKDTKQLIETQKSLMGMLGTMKPMMNDGKELMETFQQMFGENAKM
jgi:hypothetical protein